MKTENNYEHPVEAGEYLFDTAVGDAMNPTLKKKRDVIVLKKPTQAPKKADVILYRSRDGRRLLRRIVAVAPDGTYTVRGDHQTFSEYGVTEGQIVGVLVGFVRKGVFYHRTDSPSLTLYGHARIATHPIRSLWILAGETLSLAEQKIKRKIGGTKEHES